MRSSLACLLLTIVLTPGNRLLAADNTQLATLVGRGIAFLESAQAEDGSYSSHAGTGVTSLVTTALLRNGRTPQDPWVAKSLVFFGEARPRRRRHLSRRQLAPQLRNVLGHLLLQ